MYVVTFLHIPDYEEDDQERVEQFCYTNIYGPFPTQDKALEWAKSALQADIDNTFEEWKKYAKLCGEDAPDEKDKPVISSPDVRTLFYEGEGGAHWSCVHKLEEIKHG